MKLLIVDFVDKDIEEKVKKVQQLLDEAVTLCMELRESALVMQIQKEQPAETSCSEKN